MGKWLMDIAKYLVTAVLISALFRDIQEKSTIVVFGVSSAVFILFLGLLLVREPKNKMLNQEN